MRQKNKEEKINNRLRFNLYKLMKNSNITQSDLSRALDIPYATLNKILKNEDLSPRVETLIPIAKYFDVTFDQLIGRTALETLTTVGDTQEPIVPEQAKFKEWRPELFKDCIDEVTRVLNQKKQIVSLEQALQMSKDTYLYLIARNEKKVDKDFVLWVVEHSL